MKNILFSFKVRRNFAVTLAVSHTRTGVVLTISAFATSVLLGLLVGGAIVLLNSQSTSSTMVVTSSDQNSVITDEVLDVQSKHKVVKINTSFVDRGISYTNAITIDRRELQYQHSLGFDVGYFMNAQMPFVSVSYSYRQFLVSAKIGYSLKLRTTDYGIGIGYKWEF